MNHHRFLFSHIIRTVLVYTSGCIKTTTAHWSLLIYSAVVATKATQKVVMHPPRHSYKTAASLVHSVHLIHETLELVFA